MTHPIALAVACRPVWQSVGFVMREVECTTWTGRCWRPKARQRSHIRASWVHRSSRARSPRHRKRSSPAGCSRSAMTVSSSSSWVTCSRRWAASPRRTQAGPSEACSNPRSKGSPPGRGRAVGSWVSPGGGDLGSQLATQAGQLLGLELEGLSEEDREFEASRQLVRLASSAAEQASTRRITPIRRQSRARLSRPRPGNTRRACSAAAWPHEPSLAPVRAVGPQWPDDHSLRLLGRDKNPHTRRAT